MRKITAEQADAIYTMLVNLAGQHDDERGYEREAFIYHVTKDNCPATEYRLQSNLAWGGKFRNNGNRNNTPYVDCYREHLNSDRQAIIDACNAALKEMFS